METGFPAIFTLQNSQCVLPFQFQCQLRRSVTASNRFILAVYFLCTSDSYIFLSCSILHLLHLSCIISHKLNYALPGSMFSFSRSIYVIYLSMVGWCHSFNCQNHVSLLLMACKPLSIKLEHQDPQLPSITFVCRKRAVLPEKYPLRHGDETLVDSRSRC